MPLFAQAESGYQVLVSFFVFLLEIAQQVSSLPDEFKQASLGIVIMLVGRHMGGQLIDTASKHGNLNLGRAVVLFI